MNAKYETTWPVAFAALAIALGCPPERVGELYEQLRPAPVPGMPQAAVWQMSQALGRMLDER